MRYRLTMVEPLQVVPSVGIEPTYRVLQTRTNLSQLTWRNMVAMVGLEPTIDTV